MNRKRTVKPRFWLLMMAALTFVFIFLYASQGNYMSRQSLKIEELEAQRTEKLSEKAALERKIAFTKTEKYVERVAHEELGLLRENEIRFVLGS